VHRRHIHPSRRDRRCWIRTRLKRSSSSGLIRKPRLFTQFLVQLNSTRSYISFRGLHYTSLMHYTIKGAGHLRDIVLSLGLQLQHLALIMIILLAQVLALLDVLLKNVLQATQSHFQYLIETEKFSGAIMIITIAAAYVRSSSISSGLTLYFANVAKKSSIFLITVICNFVSCRQHSSHLRCAYHIRRACAQIAVSLAANR